MIDLPLLYSSFTLICIYFLYKDDNDNSDLF